jgi:methionyl aminopeptidase
LDLGVFKDDMCGDAALTIGIGEISTADNELLRVAMGTLFAGIVEVKDGAWVKEIGGKMNKYAEVFGYVTNRTLSGHAIGIDMHMEPSIPNFYQHNNNARLEEGMIICIEPQVTKKDRQGQVVGAWDFRTQKGKKSAFFEHMIKVTKEGYEILTTHIPHHY